VRDIRSKGTDRSSWMIRVRVVENISITTHSMDSPEPLLKESGNSEAVYVFLEPPGPQVGALICFFNEKNILKGHATSSKRLQSFTYPLQPWGGGRLQAIPARFPSCYGGGSSRCMYRVP
jgi:hypothetical protein